MKDIFTNLIIGWRTRKNSSVDFYSANKGNIPEDMIELINIISDLQDRIERLEAKNDKSN